ncbi:MAG TPA: hypothetical protein VLK65_26535 [Vicinamibacteria bacterium]|nr:hypothetical protein [Vicinamibacteria bacterium]
MKMRAASMFLVLLTAPAVLAAGDDPVQLTQANIEIPESRLLDVGIHVFDPGLPEDEYERYLLEEKGVFEDVRKSEARYIPIVLKRTLESSGFWGAVRLVPATNVVDLHVRGSILKSTGKDLELEILVTDARGESWMRKKYDREADPLAYVKESDGREPFQSLYNQIANDVAKLLEKLDPEELVEIRRVSELQFAHDLAPDAYAEYLTLHKGRFASARLPSQQDPMMERIGAIRERDYMFIDTLNEYYADLFAKMEEPYDSWRSFSYEEQMAFDALNRKAKWEKILGIAAMVGGAVASTTSNSRGAREAGQIAMLGGMVALNDGLQKSQEAKMHREALHELAQSFDTEAAAMLIDVEGEVLRLTGSVESQYGQWRELLRQIFATELGLPVDPNATSLGRTKS